MMQKLLAFWVASLFFGVAALAASAKPSLPDIYRGYRAAQREGTVPALNERALGDFLMLSPDVRQIDIDWKTVFLKFFPAEGQRLEKYNSVKILAWANGNFDYDPAPEVLVSLVVNQGVGSYSDVEFPIAPVYQMVFVADKEGRTVRQDSIVPLVLSLTRDADIDCGNCGGPQTLFTFLAARDFNKDGTLEVVLQKTTQWRRGTAALSERQLYANATQGWLPIQQEAPVLSEYEPSE